MQLSKVSEYILYLLKKELYPDYIAAAEDVSLIIPTQKNMDYRVGVWLYDISDNSQMPSPGYERIDDTHRRFPPMPVEMSFMIILNEEESFGAIKAEEEQQILERIMRCFHDNPCWSTKEQEVSFCFGRLTLDEKMKLWQALSKPIQPAVYIHAAPVLISSALTEEFSPVRERRTDMEEKQAGGMA